MSRFKHGDRVRHRVWGSVGTVKITVYDAHVQWDGTVVSDELELVEAELEPVR